VSARIPLAAAGRLTLTGLWGFLGIVEQAETLSATTIIKHIRANVVTLFISIEKITIKRNSILK